jgi:hypothetical protein
MTTLDRGKVTSTITLFGGKKEYGSIKMERNTMFQVKRGTM